MTYIDFYLVRPTGAVQDFDLAASLVAGDDDAEHYVGKMIEVLRDGVLDRDDMTEEALINGVKCWVFQDHNGVGGVGSTAIGNSQWMANAHPAAFKALGVTVTWGKGTAALTNGGPTQTV